MRYAFILYAGKERKYKKVEYNMIDNVDKRLEWVKSQLGVDWLEVVNLSKFIENSCLVVDEEGLLKENPQLNYIGSVLYGTPQHNHPIMGNALLCTMEYGENGYDTVGFNEKTAADIKELLKSMQAVKA